MHHGDAAILRIIRRLDNALLEADLDLYRALLGLYLAQLLILEVDIIDSGLFLIKVRICGTVGPVHCVVGICAARDILHHEDRIVRDCICPLKRCLCVYPAVLVFVYTLRRLSFFFVFFVFLILCLIIRDLILCSLFLLDCIVMHHDDRVLRKLRPFDVFVILIVCILVCRYGINRDAILILRGDGGDVCICIFYIYGCLIVGVVFDLRCFISEDIHEVRIYIKILCIFERIVIAVHIGNTQTDFRNLFLLLILCFLCILFRLFRGCSVLFLRSFPVLLAGCL